GIFSSNKKPGNNIREVFVVLMIGDTGMGNQWNLVKLVFEGLVDKEDAFVNYISDNLIKELPEDWKIPWE
ncbi:MAG: hypothetical protein LBS57_07965, partial [Treponema sp.]|nr:hypothetical protein [Treponema sp.]